MSRYNLFRSRFSRVADSVLCFSIAIVGVVGVVVITDYTNRLELKYQEELSKVAELEVIVEEEEEIQLDIDKLFTMRGISLNEREKLDQLIRELPVGELVKKITIGDEAGMYGVYIEYDASDYAEEINDTRIDQNILINSVILMSLSKDINTIDISLITDTKVEQRLFYREDIENYLGKELTLEQNDTIEYFKRNTDEFLDSKKINEYAQFNKGYASEISKEIDKFYKANFPVGEEVKSGNMPYMPENLGQELVEKYGYKLFVEGLKYDNEYINYYSAYRLLEFYGDAHLEEILVELAICKNKTNNVDIKTACDYVSNIFTHSDYETDIWVTPYKENNAGGGTKVYRLYHNKLQLWAVFEQPTKVENIITSIDNKNVWCSASSQGNHFTFVLPVNETKPILITPKQTIVGEVSYPEIISLMESTEGIKYPQQKGVKDSPNMLVSWYANSYLHITTSINDKTYRLLYNTKDRKLRQYNDRLEGMQLEELLYELSYLGELVVQDSVSDTGISSRKVRIKQDYITVYEGDKNSETIKSLKESYSKVINANVDESPRVYQSDKILVSYTGDNSSILSKLDEIFKVH